MADYLEIFCGVAALIFGLYYYMTCTFNFWQLRGVPGPRPQFFFGNVKELIQAKVTTAEFLKEIYDEYKNEPLVGLFSGREPVLLIRDLDIIKQVLIQDFNVFSDRGYNVCKRAEPMSQNIGNLKTPQWQSLRPAYLLAFSSEKIREMYSCLQENSTKFVTCFDKFIDKEKIMMPRTIAKKYVIDMLSEWGFGIDTHALESEGNDLQRMVERFFEPTTENVLRKMCNTFFPKLYNFFGYIFPEKTLTNFYTKFVKDALDIRKQYSFRRYDFIGMFADAKIVSKKFVKIKLPENFLAAQVFFFFAAGFDTTVTTIINIFYELALNQNVQDKAREEVRECYVKYGKDLNFDNLAELKYINKVVKETLRLHPIVTHILRRSTTDYTFRDTNVTIPKGTLVWIPHYSIHRDPNIYSNPDTFDPDRFSEDSTAARHDTSFLSFGLGPRNCVGERFALCNLKLILYKVLYKFKIEPCERTVIPYEYNPHQFVLKPKQDIYLKLIKLEI